MIVGFQGIQAVILAKLLTRKTIILTLSRQYTIHGHG